MQRCVLVLVVVIGGGFDWFVQPTSSYCHVNCVVDHRVVDLDIADPTVQPAL